jgi:ribonucleoside-diphosphate reductase alpha subunit
MEYTAPDEVAVCNLASIALPMFVENGVFNFQKLYEITKVITRNLNKIIDENYYPIPEAKKSNMRHRPIGIGVQGLADAFIKMRYSWESPEARQLNRDIFETIYFAAMESSCEIAQRDGAYETYQGSPLSQGVFQFDFWGQKPSGRWDWDTLKSKVKLWGARNSLLVAPMPTASTAQILGNNEGFEPYTSNIFSRKVLSGDFPVVNQHLVDDLMKAGLWNSELREKIIACGGSVQYIDEIPQSLKDLYKTVWEIHPSILIDMAADRGPFICQSQSFNIFAEDADYQTVCDLILYAVSKKLKTISYYLRTRPAAEAIQFTVDVEVSEQMKKKRDESIGQAEAEKLLEEFVKENKPVVEKNYCTRDNPDCLVCGS